MRGVQTAPLRATLQFLACSLALLAAAARAEDPSSDSTFVGWQGESFDKAAVFGQGGSGGEAERWIETISWTPRAFIYHNLLTPDEADALILQAAPHMKRSTVVGGEKNSGVVDNIRTSYGTFLDRLSSPAVETLEKKLANWTQLPIINQEDIQARTSAWSALSALRTRASRVPVPLDSPCKCGGGACGPTPCASARLHRHSTTYECCNCS